MASGTNKQNAQSSPESARHWRRLPGKGTSARRARAGPCARRLRRSLPCSPGTQPAQNGVWGYCMPDPSRPERSMSGFHGDLTGKGDLAGAGGARARVLADERRVSKRCPLAGPSAHMVFGFDGYRLWMRPSLYHLGEGHRRIDHRGIRLQASMSRTLARGEEGKRPEGGAQAGRRSRCRL